MRVEKTAALRLPSLLFSIKRQSRLLTNESHRIRPELGNARLMFCIQNNREVSRSPLRIIDHTAAITSLKGNSLASLYIHT